MQRFRLLKNVRGTTSIEYGLIAALISCGIILSLWTLGGNLEGVFSNLVDGLDGPTAPAPANTNHFNG